MSALRFVRDCPDTKDFVRLFETTGWNSSYGATETELANALAQSWCVDCAYSRDTLVGVGRVVSDGVLYAMLYDVIVHPAFRERGIGKKLVERLVHRALEAGIRDIQLFAAEGTEPFYQRCGFSRRPHAAPGMSWKGS